MYSHTGTFSKLIASFTLKREFGHFIIDVYIPSILFVISSWTSFWVEIPAAPARVTLGITTMLTLVTSARTAREKLPRVSYIHALDIWIIMCTCNHLFNPFYQLVIVVIFINYILVFIFASLVEYATVNFIYNKDKRSKKKKRNSATGTSTSLNNGSLKRTLSSSSFKSYRSSDSVYSTVQSNVFLKVSTICPQIPLKD